jgi:hypothetical protein
MKKLISWAIFTGIVFVLYMLASGAEKSVVCVKDTGEIIGVVLNNGIKTTRNTGELNIACENNRTINGVKTEKILITAVDEKSVPADINTQKIYKINPATKDIYEPVTIEYIDKQYMLKNIKNPAEIIGKVKLVSGTAYGVYNIAGVKIGTYTASVKLTATNIKGKEYKLIKITNTYIIKE